MNPVTRSPDRGAAPLAAPTSHAAETERDRADAVPVASLSVADRDEMLALLMAHFDGVTSAQFARDLDEKNWVLRVHRGARLLGFSTMQVVSTVVAGQPARVLYSGDTIVAAEAAGSPVLARGWIATVRRLQALHPAEPWYWLLLSSGYRTYRFLPVFWREFWPRHDAATPAAQGRLLAQLAHTRFGANFDERSGVVRFAQPQRLRGALALVPDGRRHDPHVQFFLDRNPGHAAGDELVCLTELSDANLTDAGRRMLRGDPR